MGEQREEKCKGTRDEDKPERRGERPVLEDDGRVLQKMSPLLSRYAAEGSPVIGREGRLEPLAVDGPGEAIRESLRATSAFLPQPLQMPPCFS